MRRSHHGETLTNAGAVPPFAFGLQKFMFLLGKVQEKPSKIKQKASLQAGFVLPAHSKICKDAPTGRVRGGAGGRPEGALAAQAPLGLCSKPSATDRVPSERYRDLFEKLIEKTALGSRSSNQIQARTLGLVDTDSALPCQRPLGTRCFAPGSPTRLQART